MGKYFSLEVDAEHRHLVVIRRFVTDVMKFGEFGRDEITRAELCINELAENVVRYGYNGAKGRIKVKAGFDGTRMLFSLTDWGVPFDPQGYVTKDVQELFDGGVKGKLGISAVRRSSDRIIYSRLKGKNKVTVYIKRRKEKAEN